MSRPHGDGSAGDADYGRVGSGYGVYRQPDPRILARILSALGSARDVLNVGAGAGAYEPIDRTVTAVEPSAAMRAQRSSHLPAAVDAVAECLPFEDDRFDASMATLTIHQWSDLVAGLYELRRVTRGPVVILTCDPHDLHRFWLKDYAPEVLAVDEKRFPAISEIVKGLGGEGGAEPVPIPLDCSDGFLEAYYGRPERMLEAGVRLACSSWSFVGPSVELRFTRTLADDLESGVWDRNFGHLRTQPLFEGFLKLVVSQGRMA